MQKIERLLLSLNDADVRYVIIGATALAAHGWVRATADLDLFVARDDQNLERLRSALTRFGYDLSDATLDDFRKFKILLRQYDLPVDLHPFVQGIADFEAVWEARVTADLGVVRTNFASLDDLIAMKRAAGRPKDLEDLKFLEKVRKSSEKPDDPPVG